MFVGGEYMPELPEVEGVVRMLKRTVEGTTIQRVEISETIRRSIASGKQCILKNIEPDSFAGALTGMRIERLERRAKYIFFYIEKEQAPYILVNHLGMTGAWFDVKCIDDMTEEKFKKHRHIVLTLNNGQLLIFSDIRRFGEMRLLEKVEDYPPLLKMAPEPFDDGAMDYFLTKSLLPKYQQKSIKEVIMDGQVISGCGNIYATEALFRQKIYPARKTGCISSEKKQALFETIVDILRESIEAGGSTISDYRNVNGEAGGMQHRLQMYGKKQCAICGTFTKQVTIAGRTSTYCPHCQQEKEC